MLSRTYNQGWNYAFNEMGGDMVSRKKFVSQLGDSLFVAWCKRYDDDFYKGVSDCVAAYTTSGKKPQKVNIETVSFFNQVA